MASPTKSVLPRFPLRLMPSVRKMAEASAAKEGVSLNQFINVAVAERLAHLRHENWVKTRKQPDPQAVAAARALLNSSGGEPPAAWDEVPAEYVAARKRVSAREPVKRRA